ncbi:MAG: hypothetical protein KatS3mg058_1005 [Roseiflexus sp.]|nr:MAG: hypothetical protein KatS3mg058_1005 [Roseiflexus sp.]
MTAPEVSISVTASDPLLLSMCVFKVMTIRLYGGTITPEEMTVCGPPGVSSSIFHPPTSSGVAP